MTTFLPSNEAIHTYDFWMRVQDIVEITHEELLGLNQCAVIEANPVSFETWTHRFDDIRIARAFTEAMSASTDDPTGSQWITVGADVTA